MKIPARAKDGTSGDLAFPGSSAVRPGGSGCTSRIVEHALPDAMEDSQVRLPYVAAGQDGRDLVFRDARHVFLDAFRVGVQDFDSHVEPLFVRLAVIRI